MFLVRDSTTSRGDYVLSVLYNENVTHYQIRRHEDDSFFSIFDPTPIHGLDMLINYYRNNQGGLVTTLNTFIKNKPPPSYDTLSGKTNLLHRVISIGNIDLVKEVVSDKSRNMETKNELGQTAAHITSILAREEIMEVLLKRRINLHSRDTKGYTPLHVSTFVLLIYTTPTFSQNGLSWLLILSQYNRNITIVFNYSMPAGVIQVP